MNRMIIALAVAIIFTMPVLADSEDLSYHGLEVEKVLNLGAGVLATALCVLTAVAYTRNRNRRLLYVSAAFMLFAVKGYLISLEMWFGDWAWVDVASGSLDFAILLSFFFGIIRR